MTASDETLNDDERRALAPYFTDLDGDVFALTALPEVVKGALFARYSRSPKGLRRPHRGGSGGIRDLPPSC